MSTLTTLAGLDELRGRIRGDVITPEDSAYDDARKVYNGSIDKRPAVIVRCFDAADVAIAIAFARPRRASMLRFGAAGIAGPDSASRREGS